MYKVRIIKPVSFDPYNLSYSVGQIGMVTKEMAELLEADERAEVIEKPKPARKKTTKK